MHSTLSAAILSAADRLRGEVRETPALISDALSESLGRPTWLKLENLQHTGSFKYRGALNRVLSLTGDERTRGVIAASSGNHGAAVARACRRAGVACTVFVPEGASKLKIAAMRRYQATVELFGTDGLDTEVHARQLALESGRVYLSPYNDAEVVAGQGTIGVELRMQVPDLDTVIVAVGGGGLIGGIATDLKAHLNDVRVVGALPEHSPVMAASVRAGHIVEMPSLPTLSDGTAGGIEPGAMTFPICRDLVDDWVLVTEAEIASAMRHCLTSEHLLVEGAAGTAVAAALKTRSPRSTGSTAVVICGGNISQETLKSIL
jgi:threonine dehydratase